MSAKEWPGNLLEILGEDGRLGVVTPEELEAALPKLAPKFEKIDRVILGYYQEGKTPRELAAELNVTVGRIHQFRLHGLAVIRDRIKDSRPVKKWR